MGPGTKENLRRIRELEALDTNTHHDGWDKCHLPVKNIFNHDDAAENCLVCGGKGTKRSTILGSLYQSLRCSACGTGFVRPVENGVIITRKEIII